MREHRVWLWGRLEGQQLAAWSKEADEPREVGRADAVVHQLALRHALAHRLPEGVQPRQRRLLRRRHLRNSAAGTAG